MLATFETPNTVSNPQNNHVGPTYFNEPDNNVCQATNHSVSASQSNPSDTIINNAFTVLLTTASCLSLIRKQTEGFHWRRDITSDTIIHQLSLFYLGPVFQIRNTSGSAFVRTQIRTFLQFVACRGRSEDTTSKCLQIITRPLNGNQYSHRKGSAKEFELSGFHEIVCMRLNKRIKKFFKVYKNSVADFRKRGGRRYENKFLIILKNNKDKIHKLKSLKFSTKKATY